MNKINIFNDKISFILLFNVGNILMHLTSHLLLTLLLEVVLTFSLIFGWKFLSYGRRGMTRWFDMLVSFISTSWSFKCLMSFLQYHCQCIEDFLSFLSCIRKLYLIRFFGLNFVDIFTFTCFLCSCLRSSGLRIIRINYCRGP